MFTAAGDAYRKTRFGERDAVPSRGVMRHKYVIRNCNNPLFSVDMNREYGGKIFTSLQLIVL